MTFGEKLSKLRKEYNYSQEQLAGILGISRQSISKWESNIAYPETEKLIKMGQLFECSMDYLLNEEVTEKQGVQPTEKASFGDIFKAQSFGALSVGCCSTGALAIGKYAAVGEHAHSMIAIGRTMADGSVYRHIGDITTVDIAKVVDWLDANVPAWLSWAKEIFKFTIQ